MKLGLIALSGVRVKDQELLKLGMTLPGFVERSEVIASLPSLSLLTIAAHTPENWDVSYLELNYFDDSSLQEILDKQFDIIAISSFSARILEAYYVSDYLMKSGQITILGGLHVSSLPEEAQQHASAIVIGEAENVWGNLLADFSRMELKKVYRATDHPKYDLSESKIPRYDLLDISKYNRLTLQTTRGCPLACNFCAASRLISSYKKKPIANVKVELESILKIWPRPFIELADDNTFVDKRWSKNLLELFSEYRFNWFTEADISLADDPELLKLLQKSGCRQVLIGLESANVNSLDQLDPKNWKRSQSDSYKHKIDVIQSYGISVNACFILGFDTDNKDTFALTRDFILDSNFSEVQITLLTPFPGTALYQKLKNERRLLKDVFWDQCTLFDVTYKPFNMSAEELKNGFHWLMQEIYSEEAVRDRKLIFKNIVQNRFAN